MRRLIFSLLLSISSWPLWAGDARYQVDTAYRHEALGAHTVESIAAQPFTPYTGTLRLGFKDGDTWIRLHIQAPVGSTLANTDAGNAPVLRVGPYFLDDLVFYEPQGGSWRLQQAGDRHAKQKKDCPDDLYCFRLSEFDGTSATVYLKLKTAGVRLVHTEVLAADEVIPSVLVRIQSMTVSLTLSMTMMVLSLVFLFFERALLLKVFCCFQLTVLLATATNTGVLAQWSPWLSGELRNELGHVNMVVRIALMVVLGWVVLRSRRPSPRYLQAVALMLAVSAVNLVGVLTPYAVWALMLNSWVMWLNTLVLLFGVLSARDMSPTLRQILVFSFSVFSIAVFVGLLGSSGAVWWLDQTNLFQSIADWRLNGVPIGLVVFWIVANGMADRKIQKLKELQNLQLEAAQSKAHQEKLAERRALIDMLTHELKTPLSTIQFALASLQRIANRHGEALHRVEHIHASVKRMDAMIEHVAMSNKIERHDAQASAETISAQALMNVVMQEYQHAERFDLSIQDGAFFHADPHFLALIVENLVSNAVKYAADGKIQIVITQEPTVSTCFQISNPVAQDSLPDENRLFERYYRHPNFQNHPGMGIGLSLVHSAAEKMGARVHFQKTGSVVLFEVRMPC